MTTMNLTRDALKGMQLKTRARKRKQAAHHRGGDRIGRGRTRAPHRRELLRRKSRSTSAPARPNG